MIKKEIKMSSRDYILKLAKANKPDAIELPKIDVSVFDNSRNILDEFILKVETAGGNVFEATSYNNVISKVTSMFPDGKVNFSTLENTESFNSVSFETINNPHELEDLDVLVLESNLGVAENGAIWLADDQIPMRVLPFITKHLVLVLNKDLLI